MAQISDTGLERRRDVGGSGGSSPGGGGDKFDIHFQALCSAVEQEKFEKARSILENQTHVNVNGVNADGFTLLDLAFMTGNQSMLNLVVTHGGKEGAFFPSSEAVSAHLLSLTTESRKQVEKFNQLVKLTMGGAAPATTLTQVQLKECEKQLSLWQKRLAVMKKLKAGFDNSVCPHAPLEVVASVTGATTVNVRVKEPEKVGPSLYTKFKIQWSKSDSFSEVVGEIEVKTIHTLEYNIENLAQGSRYFIRASFGNPKGYGSYCASRPRSVVPSSWRNVDKVAPRIQDQPATITHLLDMLLRNRSSDLADFNVEDEPDQEDGRIRKKGLLQLFQTAPKFVKTPRQGVYLTCIMYHEDKVLMTNEDSLPLIEVQEDLPSTLNADFHWLNKICYLWSDLPKLRSDMSRLNNESLRVKLVTAAHNMQSALGTENLGVCYHKPLRHQQSGAVVFSLVHHVKSAKSLVSLSLKWAPLSKAQRRLASEEEGGVLDIIRSSIRDQILFHQVSGVGICRGLHLCYLQSHTTIDSMSVVVANTSPSILPSIKIRDNPHVTSEEWCWVRNLATPLTSPTTNFLIGEAEEGMMAEDIPRPLRPTEAQFAFGKSLEGGVERLFQYLGVEEAARGEHRVLDTEIIQLGPEVSLILIIPSTDTVCSVSDNNMAINLNRGDLSLVPLQSWEVLHLAAYHRKMLTVFAKLSSVLELDLNLARQTQREALSSEEVEVAAVRLDMLAGISERLEQSWVGVRWVRDVLSEARLKTSVGIPVTALTDWYTNQPDTPDDSQFGSVKGGNIYRLDSRLDTLSNWNSRERVGGLSRTPTTRSDPTQFNVMNKENESHLTNLAHMRTRLMSDGTVPATEPHSNYSSLNSIDSNDNEILSQLYPRQAHSPEPNILQVFAAYDTGLAQGTSVKISVTTNTTAREVVDLVIKQLNMAVILKGKEGPLYENEKLRNFCLVAVIGNRERCLRDDFKPLNLQNPWKKDVKWGKTHSYINKKNPTQVTEKSHRLLQQKEKWPSRTIARVWTSVVSSSNGATNRVWVDTVSDLNQYKPSQDELEARKLARKSNNKLLAKVALSDKRQSQLDPEKQRLIQQQLLLENRTQPNQNVEAILARSEQVMEICQGILNGEMITPSYTQVSQATAANPDKRKEEKVAEAEPEKEPVMPVTPYMNSAALNEIAGELLITVRELREELLQEREARERLEREVVQQRELLTELAREVVRLQIFCTAGTSREPGPADLELIEGLETSKIV